MREPDPRLSDIVSKRKLCDILLSVGEKRLRGSIAELTGTRPVSLIEIALGNLTCEELAVLIAETGILNEEEITQLYEIYRWSRRPSLYLLRFDPLGLTPTVQGLDKAINEAFAEISRGIEERPGRVPANRRYSLRTVKEDDSGLVEITFEYEHKLAMTDAKTGNRIYLYDLRPGWIWFDFENGKAVVNVHYWGALKHVLPAIERSLHREFTPLYLNRRLMERIAPTEYIRRTSYYNPSPSPTEPRTISFSHESLHQLPLFEEHEGQRGWERTQAFYRISVGPAPDKGIGVSARRGKVWIPSFLEMDQLRTWTIDMLGRLSSALEELRLEEYDSWFKALNIPQSSYLQGLPRETKNTYIALAHAILQAKTRGLETVNLREHAIQIIQRSSTQFQPMAITECEACLDMISPICPGCERPLLASFQTAKGELRLSCDCGWSSPPADLEEIGCPSGHPLALHSMDEMLTLWPKERCRRKLRDTISGLGEASIAAEDRFWIHANVFHFAPARERFVLEMDDLNIFDRVPKLNQIPGDIQQRIRSDLDSLPEKCAKTVKEETCVACLDEGEPICLPKLVAKHVNGRVWAHSGFEFGDMAFTTGVEGEPDFQVVCVAKAPRRRLTKLRMKTNLGKDLFIQAYCLLNDTRVDILGIVSTTPLDPDLEANLNQIAQWRGRKILYLGRDQLVRLRHSYDWLW